jgi:hypothetical protein
MALRPPQLVEHRSIPKLGEADPGGLGACPQSNALRLGEADPGGLGMK